MPPKTLVSSLSSMEAVGEVYASLQPFLTPLLFQFENSAHFPTCGSYQRANLS